MKNHHNIFYRFGAALIRSLFYRIKVYGLENEPPEGPVIVCSNHISNHDVVILAAVLKRKIRYMAKKELFEIPLLRTLIRAFGAFPIDRANADVGALKHAIELLENNEVVGLFPQGTRRPGVDPKTTPVKGGVGLLVSRTKSTVLPACIYSKDFIIKPFRRTYVCLGKPLTYEDLIDAENNANDYQGIAKKVFSEICLMTDNITKTLPGC